MIRGRVPMTRLGMHAPLNSIPRPFRVVRPSSSGFCIASSFLGLFLSVGQVYSQDVLASLPRLPSGFYEAAATRIGEEERPNLREFDATLNLSVLYDSNVTQGKNGGIRPEQSDVLIQPTLNVDYRLGSGNWQIGARARVSRLEYLQSDDFNATNYSVGFYGGYDSKKLVASFSSSFSSNAGVNRLAGNFIEQESFSNRFSASYRFSSKTSLLFSWAQSSIESNTEGFVDTDSNTASLAGIWRATPLLNVGPGFRYGVRTGFDDSDFTILGPLLRADYTLSKKVKLGSRIGLDFSESSFGDDQTLFSYSVSLGYTASRLWGFNLSMIQGSQATLITGGGFDQISSLRLGFWRKIRRARLSLRITYEDRNPTDSNTANLGFRDSSFLRYNAGVSIPLRDNQANLALTVGWNDFEGSNEDFSWDGFQSGISLAWSF